MKFILHNGRKTTYAALSRATGINCHTLRVRYEKGDREGKLVRTPDHPDTRASKTVRAEPKVTDHLYRQIEEEHVNIDSLRDYAVLDGERLQDLWADRDRLRAAYEFLLPYVHIDIRDQALSIYNPEPTPLEKYIGSLGADQP